MSVPLLASKTPCEIEGRNFRRGYREPQIGKVYTIQFEVDKDLWDACELIPKTATLKGVLWWESEAVEPEIKGEPKPETATKTTAGPYAYYWEAMHRKGFDTYPDLQEALDCASEQVHAMLRTRFDVATLADVSPRTFERFIKDQGCTEALITLSRAAEIQAVEKIGTVGAEP